MSERLEVTRGSCVSRKSAKERNGVLSSENNLRLRGEGLSRREQNLASSKQRNLHLLGQKLKIPSTIHPEDTLWNKHLLKVSLNLDTSLMKMLSSSGGHTACGLTADLGFQHLNPRSFHSCPALSSFSTSPAMCLWAPPVSYTLTPSPDLSGVTASWCWGFSRLEAHSHLLTLGPCSWAPRKFTFPPLFGAPGQPRSSFCFLLSESRQKGSILNYRTRVTQGPEDFPSENLPQFVVKFFGLLIQAYDL